MLDSERNIIISGADMNRRPRDSSYESTTMVTKLCVNEEIQFNSSLSGNNPVLERRRHRHRQPRFPTSSFHPPLKHLYWWRPSFHSIISTISISVVQTASCKQKDKDQRSDFFMLIPYRRVDLKTMRSFFSVRVAWSVMCRP
jgi:hypothetical protein